MSVVGRVGRVDDGHAPRNRSGDAERSRPSERHRRHLRQRPPRVAPGRGPTASNGLAGPQAQRPRSDRGDREGAPPDPRLRSQRTRHSRRFETIPSRADLLLPALASSLRYATTSAPSGGGLRVSGTVRFRPDPPRCRCRAASRRPDREPARPPPGAPPPTAHRPAPRRRRSPPAISADPVASPGSRRRAIGNGRPRPPCSRTTRVCVRRSVSSATIDRRTGPTGPACRRRRRGPSASARRRAPRAARPADLRTRPRRGPASRPGAGPGSRRARRRR